jgi:hypothetical protein
LWVNLAPAVEESRRFAKVAKVRAPAWCLL